MEASHPPELTADKLLQHPGALDLTGCLSPSWWLCMAGVPVPRPCRLSLLSICLAGLWVANEAALFLALASGHAELLWVA